MIGLPFPFFKYEIELGENAEFKQTNRLIINIKKIIFMLFPFCIRINFYNTLE